MDIRSSWCYCKLDIWDFNSLIVSFLLDGEWELLMMAAASSWSSRSSVLDRGPCPPRPQRRGDSAGFAGAGEDFEDSYVSEDKEDGEDAPQSIRVQSPKISRGVAELAEKFLGTPSPSSACFACCPGEVKSA